MGLRGVAWPAGALVGLLAARRWLDVVEVRGHSMTPTLQPGDWLLIARARPSAGAVSVAPDPRAPGRELIKRVARIDRSGIHLRGDNPDASTDVRAFGPVPGSSVQWRAILRYWPLDRAGRIPRAPAYLEPLEEGGEPACAFPGSLIAGG